MVISVGKMDFFWSSCLGVGPGLALPLSPTLKGSRANTPPNTHTDPDAARAVVGDRVAAACRDQAS